MHRKANENQPYNAFRLITILAVSFIFTILIVLLSGELNQFKNISLAAVFFFSISGFIHFYIGFHLMHISQVNIGASKTGVLIGTTPLFTAIIGFLIFQEELTFMVLLGIGIVIIGIIMVSASRGKKEKNYQKRKMLFGLGAALCYSISPLFVRLGLNNFNYPVIAVGTGLFTALLTAIIMLTLSKIRQKKILKIFIPGRPFLYQIIAGILIGSATLLRYAALNETPLAVVSTLSRINIPVIMIISPIILKSSLEKNNLAAWVGTGFIISGALIIGFSG